MPLGEWLLAVYLGAAHTVSAPLSLPSVQFVSADYRGESWRLPFYDGYRVSYFPARRTAVGLEAELIHLKVYTNLPPESVVQRFSMSHGLNLVLANVVARRTLHVSVQGPVRLTARAGAGPTVPHVESTIGGVSKEGYQVGSLALHAGAGVEIPVARHFSVLAEYKLTRAHEHVNVGGGDARGVFLSHHGVVGIAWRVR
jgi:opacity protein-like surface antigen